MDLSTFAMMIPSTVAQAEGLGATIDQGLQDALAAQALTGDALANRGGEAERLLQTAAPEDVPALIDAIGAEQYRIAAVKASHDTVVRALNTRLVGAFGASVPAWLAEVAPAFDTAAEGFVGALQGLTADLSPSALLSSGSASVRLYEQAAEHAATLDACRGFRNTLATGIGHYASGIGSPAVEVATRYCTVEDAGIAFEVAGIFDQATGPLQPWAAIVRHEGVLGLTWHRSIQEHAAVLRALPEAPVVRGPRRSVMAI